MAGRKTAWLTITAASRARRSARFRYENQQQRAREAAARRETQEQPVAPRLERVLWHLWRAQGHVLLGRLPARPGDRRPGVRIWVAAKGPVEWLEMAKSYSSRWEMTRWEDGIMHLVLDLAPPPRPAPAAPAGAPPQAYRYPTTSHPEQRLLRG